MIWVNPVPEVLTEMVWFGEQASLGNIDGDPCGTYDYERDIDKHFRALDGDGLERRHL
jgi:hypothetical protein